MASTSFADLGVSAPVCAALSERGISVPFPVQDLVLPVAREGGDLLVKAPTGTGKTLAFGLALVEDLAPGRRPVALVLAPTRELAAQIEGELAPLGAARGLKMAVCFGGVGMDKQARRAARADVVVATPGRLLDLCRRGMLSLAGVRTLVLDEADRMLDMGFLPQVEAVIALLPEREQTMLFSATLDGEVARLAQRITRNPARLEATFAEDRHEPLTERLEQSFLATTNGERTDTLIELIQGEDGLVLVFCRTRRGAARLAERLEREGVRAAALHGDLTQSMRERTLRGFAGGRPRVLAATDVASRGIDLDDVGLVVNFDPPDDHDAYTHRVGRTARAGRTGRAVTLVMPEHADDVGRIAARLGLDEHWTATGYAMSGARVVYRSRRKGSAFAAPARPGWIAARGIAAAQASKVRRPSRSGVRAGLEGG